ncbi:hypothetical protein CC78DRAFT_531621 [Lojkania enalia]|uniref:Uncharacterized protein n=1 Tax=Lojkania enalia TaxID=147567 RepID=A0A9P4KF36_9PLEO|nr:hypothetical protein CC78DRAFT_531621 [Didymosphaeria enalia]
MAISAHPGLRLVATFFGTIFLGFGLNYIFRPREAYSTFGLPAPTTPTDQHLMDSFLALFGAKDLFMAVAIYSAAYFGSRKTLGIVLVMAGFCAGVDGYVVKRHTGTGEWNHWGYGSVITVVGALTLGVLG